MLRSLEPEEILHLPAATRCNNRCSFCLERSRGYPVEHSFEQYCEILRRERAALDAAIFTGGEPTLNPLLPRLVEEARALDYRIIGLLTNGRALHRRELCEALLRAGLNKLTLSLHGPSADVHDAIVGRRGAFAQVARGLQHIDALRPRHPLRLTINCSLVKANLTTMRQMQALASAHDVDLLNFNVVEPRGTAADRFAEVVPRYGEVMRQAALCDIDWTDPRYALSRVPACAGGVEWVQEAWHMVGRDRTRVHDPAKGKVQGPPCESCALGESCPGIWQRYAEGYGWEGLEPVVHPEQRAGQRWRVALGAPCNDRCAHRADGPAAAGWGAEADHPWLALRRGLLRGYRSVEIGGGEPLLCDELGRWVKQARVLGYQRVCIETNGRDLSAKGKLALVLSLGLGEVVVRLHAGEQRVHDELAGAPGAFRQSVRGLRRLVQHGVPVAVRVRRHPRAEASMELARQLARQAGAARFEVVD